MKIPREYSRVPIAPSHSIGAVFSRERKSDAIVFRAYKMGGAFASQRPRSPLSLCGFVIIPNFALKSFSSMTLGVPRLRRSKLLVCILATAILCACSNSTNTNTPHVTGLKYRVLVSQDVSTSIAAAGLQMIDANKDILVRKVISLATGGAFFPQKMYLSDNRQVTLAMSNQNNVLGIFSNAQEAGTGAILLPGPSDSIVISPDAVNAYAAVATASVPENVPGGI